MSTSAPHVSSGAAGKGIRGANGGKKQEPRKVRGAFNPAAVDCSFCVFNDFNCNMIAGRVACSKCVQHRKQDYCDAQQSEAPQVTMSTSTEGFASGVAGQGIQGAEGGNMSEDETEKETEKETEDETEKEAEKETEKETEKKTEEERKVRKRFEPAEVSCSFCDKMGFLCKVTAERIACTKCVQHRKGDECDAQ